MQKYKDVFTDITIEDIPAKMRHIELNTEKDGRDHIIICVPGIGGFAESYKENLLPLYEAGYWPVAVDNIGFGGSDKPKDLEYSMLTFSYALLYWIKENQFVKITLIGNSFGAGLSIGLWETLRENIQALILISPAGFGSDLYIGYRIASLPIMNVVFPWLVNNKYLTFNKGRKAWKSIVHNPDDIPDEIIDDGEIYKKDHGIRRAYKYIFNHLISFSGLSDETKELMEAIAKDIRKNKVPVMIVWGQDDQVIPVKQSENASKLLGGELHIFEDCGHMAYVEKPNKFNDLVIKFLNGSS